MKVEKYKSVLAPQFGVNDNSATLIEWVKKDKEKVKKDDMLCVLETTKTSFDVFAEDSGYLSIVVNEGDTISVNQEIAIIFSEKKTMEQFLNKNQNRKKDKADNLLFTKKAQELLTKHKVDLTTLSNSNKMVRASDIEELIKSKTNKKPEKINLKINKNKKSVVVYGAGKGGETIFETLKLDDEYEVVAFFDDNFTGSFLDCPVYSLSEQSALLKKDVKRVIIAIADGKKRLLYGKKFEKNGFELINAIHPKSFISMKTIIGKGNHIKAGSIIDSNTKIGDYNIIDNSVTIAHDNIIGDGCHLAPGCVLGSSIIIDDYSILGIGSSVSTKIKIGRGCIVSLNTSVINDISDNSLVEGVPGKVVGKTKI